MSPNMTLRKDLRWSRRIRLRMAYITLAAFAALTSSNAHTYKLDCPSKPFPLQQAIGHDHDRFGTRPREVMFPHAAYVSSFDSATDDDGVLAQPN